MRNYRRPLIAVAFTLPILFGCFPDRNEESSVGDTDNQNSESASGNIDNQNSESTSGNADNQNSESTSTADEAPEVTTAIGAASSNLIFGSATFDTATWK